MTDFETFDLDKVTRRAWSQFQTRLAIRLAAMDDDETLVVELESSSGDDDEVAPYVQFLAVDGSQMLVEVSSNDHLTGGHRLQPDQESVIHELGFRRLSTVIDELDMPEGYDDGALNFVAFVERSGTARLAVIVVKILRDVFRIVHPAFLKAPGLVGESTSDEGRLSPDDEHQAVVPQNRTHLETLVDDALVSLFDEVPQHDSDGDIPVVNGSTLTFLRVAHDGPRVELFSEIVRNISDLDRAPFEVGVLNRDSRFAKYVLVGDRVMASMSVIAQPFVAEHLRNALGWFAEEIDGVDDDLAMRVSGQRFIDMIGDGESGAGVAKADSGDAKSEPAHPAMLTILQLEADSPGSVDPEQAASICEYDRALILELISESERDEIAWRESRDQALLNGDPDGEAGVCDIEMKAAERMAILLRRALRHVVQSSSGRQGAAPGQ